MIEDKKGSTAGISSRHRPNGTQGDQIVKPKNHHVESNKNGSHSLESLSTTSILELPSRSGAPNELDVNVRDRDESHTLNSNFTNGSSSSSSSSSHSSAAPSDDENELRPISSPIQSAEVSKPVTPTRSKKVKLVSPTSLQTIDSVSNLKQEGPSESETSSTNHDGPKKVKRKRKRGRVLWNNSAHVKQTAVIEPSIDHTCDREQSVLDGVGQMKSPLWLPVGQYECILQRRAIRKREMPICFTDIPQPKNIVHNTLERTDTDAKGTSKWSNSDELVFNPENCDGLEVEGDTSLGMKLTILSGKVIVQKLMPLQDGRASPAQLTGMVSRGDVLMSIDGRSLVGLGNLDVLVDRLKPLSTPNEKGEYKRNVRIRFAVGEGLELLQKDDKKGVKKKKTQPLKTKRFQVGQYTMVDQLSGAPLFHHFESWNSSESKDEALDVDDVIHMDTRDILAQKSFKLGKVLSLQDAISMHLAMEHQIKKSRSISGYFLKKDNISPLLKEPVDSIWTLKTIENVSKDKEERLELGKLVLARAKALYDEIELGPRKHLLDPLEVVRSECRSFSSRSRFSLKYEKKVLASDNDSSSDEEEESDAGTAMSGNFETEEIGDEMLLRLAVWNRHWKRRMVETLEAASVHTRDKRKYSEAKSGTSCTKQKNDDLETQLQKLMFGSEVVEMMNKKKPTIALPPEEITEVLFDLATRVTATIPSNVSILNNLDTSIEEFVKNEIILPRTEKSRADREIIEATRFLIEDILPAWMNTFKPIPPSQRRVVWPRVKDDSGVVTPDDLSMESAATGWSTNTPERRTKLEDKIAHLELDADTKAETCELVTFYFKRKILQSIAQLKEEELHHDSASFEKMKVEAHQNAVRFVQSYGSYLKLFDSLVAASETVSVVVMNALLEVAKYDPTHIEYTKQLMRNAPSMSYEPKLLSSLLARINDILGHPDAKLPDYLLQLVVTAYPDIKPWQIRAALSSFRGRENPGDIVDENTLKTMKSNDAVVLYSYLTMLMESSNAARMDENLVLEWCNMSVSNDFQHEKSDDQLRNFMKVAKCDNLSHVQYFRDLSFLIDASVKINNSSLMLDLAQEIISNVKYQNDSNIIRKTVGHLVNLGLECVKGGISYDKVQFDDNADIRKVLILLNKTSSSPLNFCRNSIHISRELVKLLNGCAQVDNCDVNLLRLMADIVSPRDCLEAMSIWLPSDRISIVSIIPIVRRCLTRGPQFVADGEDEISSALHRVRRLRLKKNTQQIESINRVRRSEMTVWEQMKQGVAIMDK
jgi:hypothetical protein